MHLDANKERGKSPEATKAPGTVPVANTADHRAHGRLQTTHRLPVAEAGDEMRGAIKMVGESSPKWVDFVECRWS